MKKALLLIGLVVLATAGCKKKPSCDLTKQYSATAGERVGDFFACKNKEAIAEDIQNTVEKLKLCTEPVQTGMVASVVCKPVSKYVADLIIKEGLPKKWECSGGVGGQVLESAIYASCSALPF